MTVYMTAHTALLVVVALLGAVLLVGSTLALGACLADPTTALAV